MTDAWDTFNYVFEDDDEKWKGPKDRHLDKDRVKGARVRRPRDGAFL